jgi:hypothetical protein
LHGMPPLGPRMGSVTYRMLCLMPTLVLALPPKHAEAPHVGRLGGGPVVLARPPGAAVRNSTDSPPPRHEEP